MEYAGIAYKDDMQKAREIMMQTIQGDNRVFLPTPFRWSLWPL
jgi:hypothetical protein